TGMIGEALVGDGTSGESIQTNWETNFTNSFTIGLWIETDGESGATYIFGDIDAGSFRCFYGGAADSDALLLRNPIGSDVDIPDAADGNPHYVHIVFDYNNEEVIGYVDGIARVTESLDPSPSWPKGSN